MKGLALAFLALLTRTVILALSLGMAAFAAALALEGVKDAHVYPGAAFLLKAQAAAQAPFVAAVRANLPHAVGGVDYAPWFYLAALLVLWVVALTQSSRLNGFRWSLSQQNKRAAREKVLDAERAERLKAQKAAMARLEADAKARADRESLERARRAAELDAEQRSLEAVKVREADRLAAESRLAAEAELREAEELAERSKRAVAASNVQGGSTQQRSRDELLELMAQAKMQLEKQKRTLSFLSIDVVDSTGMKIGEDPSIATRDFKLYRKLVEKAIADNSGLKAAWTPDGVMICFPNAETAVAAAKQVIAELTDFNLHVKAMRRDFRVRCGVNTGTVLFDDAVPMEEMSDRSIDIAGHMQKYADVNAIYAAEHVMAEIRGSADFAPAAKEVDGHRVYAWRASDN